MPSLSRVAAVATALLAVAPSVRADGGTAARLAQESLAACEDGRLRTERIARKAAFERGQALGERAVAADDHNADAHFAVFCNMGELMRIDGESITSVFSLRRLMAELDRTLAIDPQHANALAAKGTLLVRLPRVLGGDAGKGEEMLRRVIQIDPNAVSTRLTLAKMVEARGNRAEAIDFAGRALQIARTQGRADKIAEAQAILAELGVRR
jgi:hypothetical protein